MDEYTFKLVCMSSIAIVVVMAIFLNLIKRENK